MTIDVKTNESGVPFYLATAFDMSSNTEITFKFTKPDGTTADKTKGASEVTLGTTSTTLPGIGAVNANEWAYYTIEPNFFDQTGTWCVYILYTNTAATPDDNFPGTAVSFTVSAPGCA